MTPKTIKTPPVRVLHVSFGTSRGADTYGYNLVTLRENGTKKASACGGGYDMRGTVFADWLQAEYQDRLMVIRSRMESQHGYDGRYLSNKAPGALYGGTYHITQSGKKERVTLDGGCGFSSIQRIAEAIDLEVRLSDAGKKLDVIVITDTRS